MFDAQLIPTAIDGSPIPVYSPWLPRQGDMLRATLDLIMMTISGEFASFDVLVFHKNADDSSDGTAATGSITQASVGRTTAEFGPLKELVRYRFAFSSSEDGAGEEWAMFRMLSLVWFDEVKA